MASAEVKYDMRLRILGGMIANICLDEPGTKFTAHPVTGVNIEVEIRPAVNLPGPVWDQVYINGEYCGNRHGGVKRFMEIVNAAKPEIDFEDK